MASALPASIEVLWGHILYRHRDVFAKRKRTWFFAVAFLLFNMLRAFIQMVRYQSGSTDNNILYWYSSIGLICAACTFLFGLSLIRDQKATSANRFICKAASYTFSVYLIHYLVIAAMNTVEFRTRLNQKIDSVLGTHWMNEIVFTASMIIITAAISFALAMAFRKIRGLLQRCRELKKHPNDPFR